MSSLEAALFLQRYALKLKRRAAQISTITVEDAQLRAVIVRHAGRMDSIRDELLLDMENNHATTNGGA